MQMMCLTITGNDGTFKLPKSAEMGRFGVKPDTGKKGEGWKDQSSERDDGASRSPPDA
jgi:hypothetical protein